MSLTRMCNEARRFLSEASPSSITYIFALDELINPDINERSFPKTEEEANQFEDKLFAELISLINLGRKRLSIHSDMADPLLWSVSPKALAALAFAQTFREHDVHDWFIEGRYQKDSALYTIINNAVSQLASDVPQFIHPLDRTAINIACNDLGIDESSFELKCQPKPDEIITRNDLTERYRDIRRSASDVFYRERTPETHVVSSDIARPRISSVDKLLSLIDEITHSGIYPHQVLDVIENSGKEFMYFSAVGFYCGLIDVYIELNESAKRQQLAQYWHSYRESIIHSLEKIPTKLWESNEISIQRRSELMDIPPESDELQPQDSLVTVTEREIAKIRNSLEKAEKLGRYCAMCKLGNIDILTDSNFWHYLKTFEKMPVYFSPHTIGNIRSRAIDGLIKKHLLNDLANLLDLGAEFGVDAKR